jgi:enterochelin esterase-like enzyme
MKIRLLLVLLLASFGCMLAADTPAGMPASTNVPGASYPRLLPDNRVVFRVKAPEAQSVKFRIYQAYDAEKDAEGFWTVTTDPQVPGFHYYWLVIDGVQVNDPGSETFYGTGKQTSGLEIPEPGDAGDYYQVKQVPHGDIRERWYHSSVTQGPRRFFIYTPPGYDQDRNARYPVLYLQHGGGEDERAWPIQGRVAPIMDNLIATGQAKPMLIVMERGYAVKPGEAEVPFGPGANANLSPAEAQARTIQRFGSFEAVVVKDLIPLVDATYRTIPDRNHRAIAGFSMGGGQAFMIGLRHPDLFASIGGLSGTGGVVWDASAYYGGVFADAAQFNARTKFLFLGHGGAEPERMMTGFRGFHQRLTELGIKHHYYVSEGTGHVWLTERRNLREFSTRLFR